MKSNQLWRPSEQVLHFLTECKQQPVVVEQILERSNAASLENQHPWIAEQGIRRQAPGVWRPPVAMNPNCPARQPLDEWQLPAEQPKLPESFFLGDNEPDDDQDDHQQVHDHIQIQHQQQQHSGDELSGSDASQQQQEFGNSNNNPSDDEEQDELQELMPPPGASSSPQLLVDCPGGTLVESSGFTFMKQQVLARTPLFSGLGSVSFGSGGGFSVPAAAAASGVATTSSIFARSLEFGAAQKKNVEEKKDEGGQQRRVTRRSSQQPAVSGKGSSDSQRGFKPSELHGKSFVDKTPPVEAPAKTKSSREKTPGRKTRTRPLDHLMNPVKSTGSKSPQDQVPQTRSSARIQKMKNRKNLEQQKQDEEAEDSGEDQASKKRGAYFAHTGAWIAQKKSSRNAKNAFRRESEEEEDVEEAPRLKPSNGNSSGKPVTKKRSLSAMSQEINHPQVRRKKKILEDDQSSEDDIDDEKKITKASPAARSKRGRKPQALPRRGKDSASNKVKKTSKN